MNEENLIPIEEIIRKAKDEGVDFGRGTPYNRIRYYTKLGWLPHMKRKGKNVEGHYPEGVINRLKAIQNLKEEGKSNDEITEELQRTQKIKAIEKIFKNKINLKKALIFGVGLLLGLLILNDLGIINIGKTRRDISPLIKRENSFFP